ncbi:MAG: AAA family ATPase [Deltaproteobacteria bacterium]|nr:AAA family ATPase [Deltaproteobacteria bacterium]
MASPNTEPASPATRFLDELEILVRASHPLVYLVSAEEKRVDGLLASLAERHQKPLYAWSFTRGVQRVSAGLSPTPLEGTEDPVAAFHAVARLGGPSLVVFKDLHAHLAEPRVVRALRELGHGLREAGTTCVLLAPTLVMPVELEKDVHVLDVPLPTFRELSGLLRGLVTVPQQGNRVEVELKREELEQLVRAAQGLTLQEAESAFAKALAADQKIDANDIALVLEEKRQVIRKSGLLEYHPAEENLGGVGGMLNLKAWIQQRTAAFSAAARNFGLPEPRGVLLLGVQGCGKTLTAKAIASQWGQPLLRLDMGRIFGGSAGGAEENLRRAIAVAESAAPAVLWIDEIDKALGGLADSSGDGGVSARILGALLTWLQEKSAPVFLVATANRIDVLPPELLRKGRFDEIFFVDLPSQKERAEIFAIHLRRRGRDPAKYECGQLGAFADGFSGAEIEQVVVSALHLAFSAGVEVAQEHLVAALRETYPLSKTLREEIQALRVWALDRARRASPKETS